MIYWNTIETAPMDGTRILLARVGTMTVSAAHWDVLSARGWSGWVARGDPTHWAMLEYPRVVVALRYSVAAGDKFVLETPLYGWPAGTVFSANHSAESGMVELGSEEPTT